VSQLALEFERSAGKGPKIRRDQVAKVVELLRGRDWQTSKDLGCATEADKRILRAIAEASEGQIISGQNGYKLTIEATLPEIDAAAAWLKHQGEQMIRRYTEIQRVRHRHFAQQP
jgi:hypothetical protein